jgi:hypothetical protein
LWGAGRVASRVALLFALTVLVGCDHVTKLAAKTDLEGRAARPLIHGVLEFRYVENTDVAFNLLHFVPERVRAPSGRPARALLTVIDRDPSAVLSPSGSCRRRGRHRVRLAEPDRLPRLAARAESPRSTRALPSMGAPIRITRSS